MFYCFLQLSCALNILSSCSRSHVYCWCFPLMWWLLLNWFYTDCCRVWKPDYIAVGGESTRAAGTCFPVGTWRRFFLADVFMMADNSMRVNVEFGGHQHD